jgi:predicted HD phosphohydrolase
MIAACLKNDLGDLLVSTTRSTQQQVEEFCIDYFGEETFDRLIRLGARIVSINIEELNDGN